MRARDSRFAAAKWRFRPSGVVHFPLNFTGRKSALFARPNPLARTISRSAGISKRFVSGGLSISGAVK